MHNHFCFSAYTVLFHVPFWIVGGSKIIFFDLIAFKGVGSPMGPKYDPLERCARPEPERRRAESSSPEREKREFRPPPPFPPPLIRRGGRGGGKS